MLAQAHEESAELLEKTRKSAQAEYENRINVADAEAEKIIENAHKTVELERDKTVQDLCACASIPSYCFFKSPASAFNLLASAI